MHKGIRALLSPLDRVINRWTELAIRQPNAAKLPPRGRREEISVRAPNMRCRRYYRTTPQHHLIAHEFAVVLAQRARQRGKTRIAQIGARRPLPHIPEHLLQPTPRPARHRMKRARLEQVAPSLAPDRQRTRRSL